MMLDAGQGLLPAVETVIAKVFLPSLNSLQKGWGVLDEAKNVQAKNDFIHSLTSFATVLAGMIHYMQPIILIFISIYIIGQGF